MLPVANAIGHPGPEWMKCRCGLCGVEGKGCTVFMHTVCLVMSGLPLCNNCIDCSSESTSDDDADDEQPFVESSESEDRSDLSPHAKKRRLNPPADSGGGNKRKEAGGQ